MRPKIVFMTVAIIAFSSPIALAHKIMMDYMLGEIRLEFFFADGKPVKEMQVQIFNPEGTVYLEGQTDDEGVFSFAPNLQKHWKIVGEASMGHRIETEIALADLGVSGSRKDRTQEMTLPVRIGAGLGYIFGLGALAYIWLKRK